MNSDLKILEIQEVLLLLHSRCKTELQPILSSEPIDPRVQDAYEMQICFLQHYISEIESIVFSKKDN